MSFRFFNKLFYPNKISTYLSHSIIGITLATTIIIGLTFMINQAIHSKKLIEEKKEQFNENEKQLVKSIVEHEIEYIDAQYQLFEKDIYTNLKKEVDQVYQLAEMIYQEHRNSKSKEEIKQLLIDPSSLLKFILDSKEIFITTIDGYGVYYPRNPEFKGKDLKKLKDANGNFVVQKEVELLRNNVEGFLSYHMDDSPAQSERKHRKVTYVKKNASLGIYFGARKYPADVLPEFQNEIASKICSVRFRHGGYVFMNNIDGTPIVMDGRIYTGSINFLSHPDTAKQSIFKKELDAALKPSGDYFYYDWNKLGEDKSSPKCSFAMITKSCNWIVGAGFYLNDTEESLLQQQSQLKKDLRRGIFHILIILVVLLILEIIVIVNFNKRYQKDFKHFFNFFVRSTSNYEKLNENDFSFMEFKQASRAANEMIKLKKETHEKLIKEQKKAEEADRLKTAFLANMSHEIRTPMNAILGFSELLDDTSHEEHDKTMYVKLIRSNAEHLLGLINDIIDISKIEANLLTAKKHPLKINHFIQGVEDYYKEVISSKKNKRIHFLVQKNLHDVSSILTDELRLRQVLDNLIGNAIKFTHDGSVTLVVNKLKDKIHFRVIDTGIGIPEKMQYSIFERFIQIENKGDFQSNGTGLGLAISKNIVELLGGKIGVKSTLGKGSEFYFWIPIS